MPKAIEQLALQGMSGCDDRLARVTTQILGHRSLIGPDHQFTQDAGMLILTREDIQQGSPQIRILTEPVQDSAIKELIIQEPGGGTVQAVLPVLTVTEPVG